MVTLLGHAGKTAEFRTVTVSDAFSDSEIALARAAANRLPGAWSLATERDYDGNLSLILLPEGDDAAAPSFLLDRDASGVGLGACRWEKFTRIGRFPTVEIALAAIAATLTDTTVV